MNAALFGLLGVVVGGLITSGSAWLKARADLRRQTRSAAWLVCDELTDLSRMLSHYRRARSWWGDGELATRCWADNRSLLTEVPQQTWESIARAYARVEDAERTRRSHPATRPGADALGETIALVDRAEETLRADTVFRRRRLDGIRPRRGRGA